MSTLRNQLQRASFRGVAFQVEGAEDAYGRRTVTHTFPGYDEPYTEELGKAPGLWSFEAFVAGEDYIGQAKALIDACNQPGSGYLTHPWLGGKQVVCLECRPSWSVQGLGQCRLRLTFQEEGQPRYPNESNDYAALAKSAAAASLESFTLRFLELYRLEGPSWLSTEMSAIFGRAMEMIAQVARVAGIGSQTLDQVLGEIDDVLDIAEEIVNTPEELAEAVGQVLDGVGQVGGEPASVLNALASLASLDLAVPAPLSAASATLATAAESFQALVGRLAVAHGISAAMEADHGSRQEALAARDQLVAAIDALSESASVAGDDAGFEALRQLRAAAVRALNQKAGGLPGVIQRPAPSVVTPTLVLAYQLYGDLDREAEILARNPAVIHPGFLPGGQNLEVLDA